MLLPGEHSDLSSSLLRVPVAQQRQFRGAGSAAGVTVHSPSSTTAAPLPSRGGDGGAGLEGINLAGSAGVALSTAPKSMALT